MTELGKLISVNSTQEFYGAIRHLANTRWRASVAHYLKYDDGAQTLCYDNKAVELDPQDQGGACALTLRPTADQSLSWAEGLENPGGFRISTPLFHHGSLNGVLYMAFEEEPTLAVINDIKSLSYLLGIVAAKVQQTEHDQVFLQRCQEFLVRAVEARGQDGHVQKCSRLAGALGNMLDLSAQVKAELMQASQYHDIGLLSAKDTNSIEARRDHPLIGAKILASHPEFQGVAHLVESHHERYDGSGQPHGKKGSELSLECWILALAEDVLETWEANPSDYAANVKTFFQESAKHHHPDVVDALCGLVDSGKLIELLA